ncbi:coiled-coil domain-containing protein 84 isoform X2 [Megalops cyprinoides]|uniref:coiled-coil domain-containing protein 84 isoform X2 n=1 Tax=Megalops cyprinoides TaxID=118141 RepID=UPI00186491CC|nr:coiled-coil domain-containing protein 84 isoform X2 [Megalops cyprinoides]
MGAFYCSVCRQTFFSGKKHIYGKSHQSKLKVILVKFLEKVKEARRTIRSPQVVKFSCIEHDRNFWCYCCGQEVQKHVSSGNFTVMFGGLLEHMATPEHRKMMNQFWWENKADPKLKEKFLITAEETERFKVEVAKALDGFEESEDMLIKQQAAHIRAQEQHRLEVLQSFLEPEPEQDLPSGQGQHASDVTETSSHCRPQEPQQQAGPSWIDPMEESRGPGPGNSLTFIGYQDSSDGGNVHTGAVPPWLQDDPLEGGSESAQREIGPTHQDFLKQKEQERLRRLPVNRVGANFDHSSQTDANWLPSFGRVWNSGRRWQSRHQFREEEGQTSRQKRKREHQGGEKKPRLQDQP